MSKKFFAGVLALALAVFVAGSANAAYMHTTTLKVGSKGAQVMALQQALNMTSCKVGTGLATGTFGQLTKAAVQCFQAQNGLTADGVVGPMTGLKMGAIVAGPAGNNNQPGCPAGAMFNSMTGAPCNGGSSTPSTGNLQGGAGDLTLSDTSTDVENSLKEGEDNVKVLGFKAEADGSDIAVTSVKVTFKNDGYASSSENLIKYVDSVAIYMGDKKVGSADADSFSKDSGSPDEFSKTISLSGAVVKEDDDAKFYVAVTGASSIDSDDITNADWNVEVNTVRFTDATGAILTGDLSSVTDQNFSFEDQTTDNKIDLKTSSANPDDASVQVNEDTTSDEVLALAYKLEVDNDSSDVQINSLPVTLTVANGGSNADDIDNIVDSVTVKVGSKSWDMDAGTDGVLNGSGATDFTADLDDGELVIDSGDSVEVKVYVKFNDQDGNYDEGTTVTASVDNADFDAEADGDDLSVTGSDKTGATLTLLVNGASFTLSSDPTRSTSGDSDENATYTFKVDASTFDNDIYLPKAGATAVDYDIVNASTGNVYSSGTQSVSVSGLSDSDTVNSAAVWVVGDADSSFTITVVLNNASATAGQYYARINSISFYDADDATSLTTVDVDSADFQTDPIQVGI